MDTKEQVQKVSDCGQLQALNQATFEKILGYHADLGYSFVKNGEQIGSIYLSFGLEEKYFIEWIEFTPEYRHQGYIREMLITIMDYLKVDQMQLETNEELKPMYCHFGANILEYDPIREMYLISLEKQILQKKIRS